MHPVKRSIACNLRTYVKYFITKVPSLMYRLIFRALLSLIVTRARFHTCILIIRRMIYSFDVFPLYILAPQTVIHAFYRVLCDDFQSRIVCFYEYISFKKKLKETYIYIIIKYFGTKIKNKEIFRLCFFDYY